MGTIANVPMVLSVSNQSGIQDLPSMLAGMRSGELKLNFGSGGPGTTAHLAEAMFLQMAGVEAELVQCRGSGPAITDLMGGTIQSVLDQTVTMLPLHRGKQIKAIAVASKERLPQMPDVPPFAEGGVPQFDLQIWNGLVAPQGTPKAVVDKLAQALTEAVQSPDFRARIDSLAARIPSAEERSPDSFSASWRAIRNSSPSWPGRSACRPANPCRQRHISRMKDERDDLRIHWVGQHGRPHGGAPARRRLPAARGR